MRLCDEAERPEPGGKLPRFGPNTHPEELSDEWALCVCREPWQCETPTAEPIKKQRPDLALHTGRAS